MVGPACVPAPGSALGLLLSRALSSAQAGEIVAKKEERQNNGARPAADAPLLGGCPEKMWTTVQRVNVEPRREHQ
jgi:hypothetical protein